MLPREKYLEKGLDGLSDIDLIAILVGSGVKGHPFMSVARSVVARIRMVLKAKGSVGIPDILDVDGVGVATSMKILCGIELGRRLYGLHPREKIQIKNPDEAYTLLKDFQERKQEYVVGLFLNSRFELLDQKILGIGSVDGAGILPRDIIIPALELNAVSVIIAHNHPSGDPLPSKDDFEMTENVEKALDLVGIKLLDHMIIGDNCWKSVKKNI